MPPLSPLAAELQPDAREQLDRSDLLPGVYCEYLTDSPLSLDSDMPVEPFGSPRDPVVAPLLPRKAQPVAHVPFSPGLTPSPRFTRARVYEPTPIQRPRPAQAPAVVIEPGYQSYLVQQFARPYRPLAERVARIPPPPGLELHAGREKSRQPYAYVPDAYGLVQRELETYVRCTPPLRHPTPTRLPSPPVWVHPDLRPAQVTPPTPKIPSISELLEGIPVPTWEELDKAGAQIKELYALRALIDPQGHSRRRTHGTSRAPSKNHNIWSGPVVVGDNEDGWRLPVDRAGPTFTTASQVPPYASSNTAGIPAAAPAAPAEFRRGPVRVIDSDTEATDGDSSESGSSVDSELFDSAYEAESEAESESLCEARTTSHTVVKILFSITDDFRARTEAFVIPSRLKFVPLELHPPDCNGLPVLFEDSSCNQAYFEYAGFLLKTRKALKLLPIPSGANYKWVELARKDLLEQVEEEIRKMNQLRTDIWQRQVREREPERQRRAAPWSALLRDARSSEGADQWAMKLQTMELETM